jgi:GntR family transcriptional regulator
MTPAIVRRDGTAMPRTSVKYSQLADTLRDQIESGALPPAAPLPSEAELIATYGVSRTTARAAINALKAEGLVTVLHGKGSFVRRATDRPAHTHLRAITHDSDAPGYADADLDGSGWKPAEEASTYRTEASADLALSLGLAEHAPLFVHERLLTDAAGRRMLHRLYLPFALCAEVPELEADPFRTPSAVYTLLAAAGHELNWTEYVRARMPAPDDATTLHIPDSTPMLITRRTTSTTTGRALALEETRLSADDTQLAYPLQLVPGTSQ